MSSDICLNSASTQLLCCYVVYASGEVIAIEIKRTLSPKLSPAFLESA
jgi:hypothetical protein